MEVRLVGKDDSEWDTFVRATPGGSPFHLLAWRRAVETAFGHRPHYLQAMWGSEIAGVLPLFETRGLLGGRGLVSVPYGVYGGVCSASAQARAALFDAATGLARELGAGYVELRHRVAHEPELPTKSRYVTFSRQISADDEENLNAIPRKQRRMVRQGMSSGLRSEIGLQHLEAFYDVYARSVHTLGSPVFPRRLFRAIAQEFGKDCELLTVWKEDAMLSGVLMLFFEDQVLPYYGGAHRDALQYAVNDFMYWEVMCHAARAGYRTFDFGRSRQGTGAYHFKRHWGFEPVPLPYQYLLLGNTQMPDLSPSNPKMHLAVEVWKRLPHPLTKLIGPALTRYLP